jgi:hypothetical protein
MQVGSWWKCDYSTRTVCIEESHFVRMTDRLGKPDQQANPTTGDYAALNQLVSVSRGASSDRICTSL